MGQVIQSQFNQQTITAYQTKKEQQLNLLSEVNNLLEEIKTKRYETISQIEEDIKKLEKFEISEPNSNEFWVRYYSLFSEKFIYLREHLKSVSCELEYKEKLEGERSYYAFSRTDAKWKDDKPIFILIASNHPIVAKIQLEVGKKYDFLGKKIVGTIKEEGEIYIFYEPNEFILELEESESSPAPTPQPRPTERGNGEPSRKNCPECNKVATECSCEGKENCVFCKTNEPFPIVCSCRKKSEEPTNGDEEEPDYHATLKPESEINWLEDSKSRGSSDCAYCQRGAETKQLAKCWHCGNDQVKTVHCQKIISDCSCPPPQTNCGRCGKCKPKHTIPQRNTFLYGSRNVQAFAFNQMAENMRRMNNFRTFNQPAEQNRVHKVVGMTTEEKMRKFAMGGRRGRKQRRSR